MNSNRLSFPLAASLAVAASLLLAGCGGNGLQSSAAKPSSSARPTSSETTPTESTPTESTPTPSTTRSHSASTSPTPAPTPTGPAVCAASKLGVTVSGGDGAAGSDYYVLSFRNRGTTTCFLDGHPGVSFVGHGNGTQIGEPARRTGAVRHVVLEPGQRGSALLQIGNAGNYDRDQCIPTTTDGLRVYPPDSRASVYVPLRIQACQGKVYGGSQMSVSEVRPAKH